MHYCCDLMSAQELYKFCACPVHLGGGGGGLGGLGHMQYQTCTIKLTILQMYRASTLLSITSLQHQLQLPERPYHTYSSISPSPLPLPSFCPLLFPPSPLPSFFLPFFPLSSITIHQPSTESHHQELLAPTQQLTDITYTIEGSMQ